MSKREKEREKLRKAAEFFGVIQEELNEEQVLNNIREKVLWEHTEKNGNNI